VPVWEYSDLHHQPHWARKLRQIRAQAKCSYSWSRSARRS
jgi:hypothetical protein